MVVLLSMKYNVQIQVFFLFFLIYWGTSVNPWNVFFGDLLENK